MPKALKQPWVLCTCVCALVLVNASTAHATTVVRLDMRAHLADSTAVLDVRVQDTATVLGKDGRVYTDTRLEVLRQWLGPAPEVVTVRQAGGTLQGVTHRLLGDGTLQTGERAVVFVRKHIDGRWYLTALAQSVYHVLDDSADPAVVRYLDGLTMVQRDPQGRLAAVSKPIEESATLSQLSDAIARALRRP